MKNVICTIFIVAIVLMACKKPYNPPAITSAGNYLVVEGDINSGSGATSIMLSQTTPLASNAGAVAVLGATVAVLSDQGTAYPLGEIGDGKYSAANLNLDNSHKYCLTIQTPDGNKYQSDFEPVVTSPPIDSIGFKVLPNTLQVYLNSHDASNSAKYYRWDYQETWIFHAEYGSGFRSNGTAIVPRTPDQQVTFCFASDSSSDIVIGSTAKLKQDVVYQQPILQIASTSEKLEQKYSILITQHVMSGDAYSFWTNLKQNTEQLGSIFSAQPSSLNGNIHCVNNPSLPVIGYISVCSVQQKRIFISNSQLPQSWVATYPYGCVLDTALFCRPPECQNDVKLFLIPIGSTEIPLYQDFDAQLDLNLGYLASSIPCSDCTIRGTTVQPPFWQ